MEKVNGFRFKQHDGVRKIYQETPLDVDTVKENGYLHGQCPECQKEHEVTFSNMKMGNDDCIDAHFVTWECPHCDRRLFAYLCWSTDEVASTIEKAFEK